MENVALWHERDISHSSVERMIGPDATVTLDFALQRMAGRDRQARRLPREHGAGTSTGSAASIHSQRVLIALTQKGVAREDAYASCSATPWRCGRTWTGGDFLALPEGRSRRDEGAQPAELEALFDLEYHLAHVDTIFARVFGRA